MAEPAPNAPRADPYGTFPFRVKWEGRYVAGVSKVSALEPIAEVVTHRDHGDPGSSGTAPGRAEYGPITLERGVTFDREFERWAERVWSLGSGPGAEAALAGFRKDVTIELFDDAGRLVVSVRVFRCRVSEWQAVADPGANAVVLQTIRLENEGWERDVPVATPSAPSSADPA